jgi:phosphoglucosamine mutase
VAKTGVHLKAKRKYFGTDGIRGEVNAAPMTAEIAMRVGLAAGRYFTRGEHRHRVVIGKDTRLSGYMYEPALTAGFIAVGMDVILVGPMPTPAVAMLTRSMRADLGVMISASHNPFQDNGIKLFGPDGYKLSDAAEMEIENLVDSAFHDGFAKPAKTGRATRLEDVWGRYIEFVKNTLPPGFSLEGLKVVCDCANGAAYKVAPTVLWELGADVIPVAVEPNGLNINLDCGSTHPENLRAHVLKTKADVGIALDGDADRLLVCDEKGNLADGDQLLALAAASWKKAGRLKGGAVVASILSNLGLERFLTGQGIKLYRTPVGDRHVVDALREKGLNLGGEQSGHLVFADYTTTGDGLISALQTLRELKAEGQPASKVLAVFAPLPQVMKSVAFKVKQPLEHPKVKDAIRLFSGQLDGNGRLVVRESGTEPVVRVMAEGEDEALIRKAVDGVCAAVETAA